MLKVNLSQVLKPKNSPLIEECSGYQPLKIKMHSDGTRSIILGSPIDGDLRTDIATGINYTTSYHD